LSVQFSRGLGLSRSDWTDAYGELQAESTGFERSGDSYVLFGGGDAWYIERRLSQETAMSAEEAHEAGLALAPNDAELVETYSPEGRPDTTVHVYSSEWLKGRFGGNWGGGEPGQFIIVYTVTDNSVDAIKVMIGNSP
jgi:hypothetical protein